MREDQGAVPGRPARALAALVPVGAVCYRAAGPEGLVKEARDGTP